MTKRYTDRDLLDPNFPDPRRSDADEQIARYYETRAADILEDAIAETAHEQRREMQKTRESNADHWLTRFLRQWGFISKSEP